MKNRILVVLFIALFSATAYASEPPCCNVSAIDARTGLVTAKVRATGKTFQFKADAAARRSLKVGSAVFANFKTNQISLDGKNACCQIVAARRVRPTEPAGARTMEGLTQQKVSLPIPLAQHEKGQEMMAEAVKKSALVDLQWKFLDKEYKNHVYATDPFGK